MKAASTVSMARVEELSGLTTWPLRMGEGSDGAWMWLVGRWSQDRQERQAVQGMDGGVGQGPIKVTSTVGPELKQPEEGQAVVGHTTSGPGLIRWHSSNFLCELGGSVCPPPHIFVRVEGSSWPRA